MGGEKKTIYTRDPSDPLFIGKYRIIERIGAGGLGEVFKAQHTQTHQIVAIKRLYLKYQKSKRMMGLFHKEMMILARVSHKNCVQFIEADFEPPHTHIVSSFVDGLSCFQLIKHHGKVPVMVACSLILDLLQGIDHLHCLDIIHSDITPANVLIEYTGRVFLADFGLSCLQEVENYEGLTLGTPGYLAPERLQNKPITVESDVYGVGILFYELLTGQKLFSPQLSQSECLYFMKNINYKSIQTSKPLVTKQLHQVLETALNYKHTKRYKSIQEFMYGIYVILKQGSIRYTRRALLQWMVDRQITSFPPQEPVQNIYGP